MDPYKILGVSKNASKGEIKKAYRKLAVKHHPDMGGDEEKFKQLNEAYSLLSNEQKRVQYDVQRDGAGINLNDFFHNFNPFGSGSPFEEIFGFGKQKSQTTKNIVFNLKISLDEIKRGTTKIANFKKYIKCDPCNAQGGKEKEICSMCDGNGLILITPAPHTVQQRVCHICNGLGSTFSQICNICKGHGKILKNESIKFKIERVDIDK